MQHTTQVEWIGGGGVTAAARLTKCAYHIRIWTTSVVMYTLLRCAVYHVCVYLYICVFSPLLCIIHKISKCVFLYVLYIWRSMVIIMKTVRRYGVYAYLMYRSLINMWPNAIHLYIQTNVYKWMYVYRYAYICR